MTIIEFLEARIDEDEVAALQAGSRAAGPNWEPNEDRYVYGKCVAGTGQDRRQVEHMARHDPARVLAECKAKRRIIAEHQPVDYSELGMKSPDACVICGVETYMGDWGWAEGSFPCATLKALAAVYKDHPQFQEEWA